jgi:hypothetical protein
MVRLVFVAMFFLSQTFVDTIAQKQHLVNLAKKECVVVKVIGLNSGILFWLLVLLAPCLAQQKSQFSLVIDGVEQDITAGEEIRFKLKSGAEITVLLKPKDVVTFNAASFSFDHPGTMRVAETKVDEGIFQHLLTTANGTAIITQSYDNGFESDSILDLMYGELTKDERERGLDVKREAIERKLASGQTLKGVRASYKDASDDVEIDIFAYPKPNSAGLLFITMHDKESAPDDRPLVDRFWSSLTVR